ncbi:MAG: ATP-binding cassette domain-containing protein, partial [Nitrospirae bacterium]|nr:ATP-binding cassette domain-containing protein [Nitrospirota bacterium]
MKNLLRLFAYIKPYVRRMVLAAALLAAVALTNLGLLWIVRDVVNSFLHTPDSAALNSAVLSLLALFVIQGLLTMGHSYLVAFIGQRVVADFRTRLFKHLGTLSVSFFAKRRTGELMSRLTNDVTVIQNIATNVPIDMAKQFVTLTGGVSILFYLNWRLCLLILSVIPLIVLIGTFFGRKLKRLSTTMQDRTADTSTVVEEVVSGIRIVKSFVAEAHEEDRYARHLEGMVSTALTRARILAVFVPLITIVTFGAAAGILWYGGRQVMAGVITPGDLIAFILYAGILIGPFGSFAHLFSQIREAQGATQRVFEILDTKPEVADPPGAVEMPRIGGRVAFHQVSFQYTPEIAVLAEISFEVRPGEMVALVGPSGAGKSTLIQLLHRFYDPTAGTIEIDGVDIKTVQRAGLYRQVGLVPQETILFGGSIRENIRYGKLDATDDEIIEASKSANAHAFITAFPKGYDTIVGEKGINLSGGQRQRIAIARAILKNPRLLILDEATSSLDNESEAAIQEALDRLMKGRTTFVVAHRLTTIQKADRIFVMDKGR